MQDNERRALARELHDELGQRCSALRAEAALVERTVRGDPAAASAAARRIDGTAEGLYQTVRDMLRRLRPPDLDALGLPAAIQALCERWETSSGVACVFHHDGGTDAWRGLGDAVDVTVYRVVQEALSNVSRHAGAGQVRIALRQDADPAGAPLRVLTVQDDGRGMDPQAPHGGLGLLGARERAALLGGELRIDSAPGQGLRLTMRLPVPASVPIATHPDGGRVIRVLLVDDHPVVRTGYARLLEQAGDMQVVAEADSAEQALEQWHGGAEVDVVVTDLAMPGAGSPALIIPSIVSMGGCKLWSSAGSFHYQAMREERAWQ